MSNYLTFASVNSYAIRQFWRRNDWGTAARRDSETPQATQEETHKSEEWNCFPNISQRCQVRAEKGQRKGILRVFRLKLRIMMIYMNERSDHSVNAP